MATQTATAELTTHHRPFFKSLYFQVLTAIVLGVLLGHFYPELGEQMKPLGDAFIKTIKMIIAPIIFCTVVHGIASMQDMKKVGRVGIKALIYFEALTTLALIVGLIVASRSMQWDNLFCIEALSGMSEKWRTRSIRTVGWKPKSVITCLIRSWSDVVSCAVLLHVGSDSQTMTNAATHSRYSARRPDMDFSCFIR